MSQAFAVFQSRMTVSGEMFKTSAVSAEWRDRAHFLAVAAQMMRRILVESARNRQRQKRGGGAVHVSLDDVQELPDSNECDLVALSGALGGLATFDSRMSQVVELRFFGGLTALAINPNHAEAYLYYGGLIEALGDLDGFQLKLQGLQCDSTSALAHERIALSFWNQRRYDDVIVWVNKALDRDPEHRLARELLGGAYWKMGDLERALKELKRAEARSPNEETLPALKVVRYAEVGDLDAAFKHLHLALDAHDPGMIHLAVAPQWDSLRADPRFNQCLVRMKLRSAM
jgi:tetratricopeptide (TPR) repeat protein